MNWMLLLGIAGVWVFVAAWFTYYRMEPADRHYLWELPASLILQPVFLVIWLLWKAPYGWFWWARRRKRGGTR